MLDPSRNAFVLMMSWPLSGFDTGGFQDVTVRVTGEPYFDLIVPESQSVRTSILSHARLKAAGNFAVAHQLLHLLWRQIKHAGQIISIDYRFGLSKINFHVWDLSIKVRICRANAHVAGTPISAPSITDHTDESTGQPIQLPISEAKNTFTAMAPTAKG